MILLAYKLKHRQWVISTLSLFDVWCVVFVFCWDRINHRFNLKPQLLIP